MNFDHIKVIAFDVFGTVVDWHGTVSAEIDRLNLNVNSDEFALAWRAGYKPAMQSVMDNNEWVKLDVLHRRILDKILQEFGLSDMPEQEVQHLNKVWHRLDPWPDSVGGLQRLKNRFTISTLSNGNIGLLTNMAKRAGLPWDVILSAEVFQRYKPDPATYLGVVSTFDLKPDEVMLAAAHHDDLEQARACGLGTAYIERPMEYGANHIKNVLPVKDNDLHARSIADLARLLNC